LGSRGDRASRDLDGRKEAVSRAINHPQVNRYSMPLLGDRGRSLRLYQPAGFCPLAKRCWIKLTRSFNRHAPSSSSIGLANSPQQNGTFFVSVNKKYPTWAKLSNS